MVAWQYESPQGCPSKHREALSPGLTLCCCPHPRQCPRPAGTCLPPTALAQQPLDTIHHHFSIEYNLPLCLVTTRTGSYSLTPTKQPCVLPGHQRGRLKAWPLSFIVYSQNFSFELRSVQLLKVLENVLSYHQPSSHLFVFLCHVLQLQATGWSLPVQMCPGGANSLFCLGMSLGACPYHVQRPQNKVRGKGW